MPPVVSDCPSDVILPLGMTLANWTEPTVTDNSGNLPNVIKSHEPGTSFTEGNTTVSYTFTDEAGKQAVCSFLVVVVVGECILQVGLDKFAEIKTPYKMLHILKM